MERDEDGPIPSPYQRVVLCRQFCGKWARASGGRRGFCLELDSHRALALARIVPARTAR